MKRHLFTPLGLLASFAFQERLTADIAIDPSEIVPADEQPDSQTQSWTTIAGTGLLLCAFMAMLIVRVKKARQSKPANSAGVSGESGKR
jgi:hypothetical protein